MTEQIHIALASDDRYARYAGAVIASVLKHAAGEFLYFHLLDSGISAKNKEKILSLQNFYGKAEFLFHPVDAEKIFPEAALPDYISRSAMVRLALPEILPELERVLYLDCDVIVKDSLLELWQTQLASGCAAAGVHDYNSKLAEYCRKLDLNPDEYVNSGVLLMDLIEWRKCGSVQLFQKALAQYGMNIKQGDQDLINLALKGRIACLPLRWNLSGGFFKHELPAELRPAVLEAMANPGVIHFTSSRKPWRCQALRHPLWEEYFKAVDGTCFAQPYFHFFKKYLPPRCRAVVPKEKENE